MKSKKTMLRKLSYVLASLNSHNKGVYLSGSSKQNKGQSDLYWVVIRDGAFLAFQDHFMINILSK